MENKIKTYYSIFIFGRHFWSSDLLL